MWISNSGKGGEPKYKENRQLWSGKRMHIATDDMSRRTWVTPGEWESMLAMGVGTERTPTQEDKSDE